MRNDSLPSPATELRHAALGDRRLDRRLRRLAEQVGRAPHRGFPRLAKNESELEATYRFLNNRRVTPEAVLEPHISETHKRAVKAGFVRVLHDTTTCVFGGESEREDLGWVTRTNRGFFAHVALAVDGRDKPTPLGVIGLKTIVRTKPTDDRTWRERNADPHREFARWEDLFHVADERLAGVSSLHVMDREGDSYDLLAAMVKAGARFVVRVRSDRKLNDEGYTLNEAIAQMEHRAAREIVVSPRRKSGRSTQAKEINPARDRRLAQLVIRGGEVELRRPKDLRLGEVPGNLRLNVVHVYEPDPPTGEEPIDWKLYTTEEVATAEQVLAIVDHYRARWTIEEFFKALKTGCAFEQRQLESLDGLLNTLALLLPIAWRLLLLRSLARERPEAPATEVFSKRQIEVLRAMSERVKLSAQPTVKEAMLAVAGIGGFIIKKKRDPGWQTLGRGLEDLLLFEKAWRARGTM